MSYEIDQSGKIEDTARNTVLAYSNNNKGAVIMIAKDKRKIQERFRKCGIPKLFIDYTFAALLVLLLKPLKTVTQVTVDIEYPKHTELIGKLVNKIIPIHIIWKYIGKSSRAHDTGYKVYKGKLDLGKKVSIGEIWGVIIKTAGGYLNTGLSPANRYSAPASNQILPKLKLKVKSYKTT